MATIRQTPQLTFLVEVRYKGIRLSKTFFDEDEAKQWGRDTETKIDKGEIQATDAVITLSRALDRYLKKVSVKKRSASKEKYRIRRLKCETFAQKRMNLITPKMVADFRDRRLESVGNQTVRHDLNLLGHVYKIAIDEWNVETGNPLAKLKKPKQPPSRTRRLNAVEKQKLIDTVKSYIEGGIEFQTFVLWQLSTGMRKAETLGLTWNDIDFDRGYAYLPLTKNGLSRNVPISPAAMRIIRQTRLNQRKPFETLNEFHVRYHWRRLLKKANIGNFRVHDMRRECLSTMNENGLSASDIQLVSGHKSLAMVQRYCVMDEKKVIDKLAQIAP